jgi:hypothetical protein
MKNHIKKYLLFISLGINFFIALPALIILVLCGDIQFDIYKHLQARLGSPEIVFIGDSITLGGGIWAFHIGAYNFNVWNYGHGGLTTHQIQCYAKKASQKGFHYAFVMAGINDEDKTVEGADKSFADYKVIIQTLLDGRVTPIIQLTLYRENEKLPEFVDRLNELLINYSRKLDLKVIDLNTVLAPKKSLLPKYSSDGVHLTEVAYEVWGAKVKAVLTDMRSEQAAALKRSNRSAHVWCE